MGQGTSVVDRAGNLRIYDYPYSIKQKFLQFPWKFHWQYGRFTRALVAGFVIASPFFATAQKLTRSPENQAEWKKIRAGRCHTFFDPPKPV